MLNFCKLCDCTEAANKCENCKYNTECDYPWVSKIWKKNAKFLTPLIPGWVKPSIKDKHMMTITGEYDFCIFNAPRRTDTITIQDICVDEGARGQGISKKILTTLMEEYDRDIIAKCIKGSSSDSFWNHQGEKIGEEPSKQTTLCIYRVKNPNKKFDKIELF